MSVATYTLIPEEQLQTWARSADTQKAVTTNESIRNAIGASQALKSLAIDTYLQGSYGNSTNIRGDSDVDLVAQLDSVFVYDLSLLSRDDRWLHRSESDPLIGQKVIHPRRGRKFPIEGETPRRAARDPLISKEQDISHGRTPSAG